MRTCSPRLVGLASMQCHNFYFQARLFKTGLCLSFYHRKGQWIQDQQTSFAFCAELPREGRGGIHHHRPPCVPPSSEQLQHHLPGDLGCWQPVLRDELCVSVSCFSRHRVDLSNETLECFMCHLPRAARCQPAEFTAALPLGDKRSHKSSNSFAGSQQHII